MRYMMLIYHDEQAWDDVTEDERQQIYAEYRQLIQELTDAGQFIVGDELQPSTTATGVQARNGTQIVTDGPFAETREQLGGYFLVNAKDLDEAIGIAGRIPSARTGAIEVRPVVEQ